MFTVSMHTTHTLSACTQHTQYVCQTQRKRVGVREQKRECVSARKRKVSIIVNSQENFSRPNLLCQKISGGVNLTVFFIKLTKPKRIVYIMVLEVP